MQSTYIPLSDVVNSYLNEAELSPDDNFVRFYMLAQEGFRNELAIDFAAEVKTVELDVLANNTAILPRDMINYTRIGVLNSEGAIATITRNDNLTFNKSCDDDRLGQDVQYANFEDEQDQLIYWSNVDVTAAAYQPLYGIGSMANIGKFRMDLKAGKIIFDFNFYWRKVILEYVAVPSLENGNWYCHELLQDAIKAYIGWASIRAKKNIGVGEKQYAERKFWNARMRAMKRLDPVDIVQINEAIKEGTFLALKG
jgi:hypothetical protein